MSATWARSGGGVSVEAVLSALTYTQLDVPAAVRVLRDGGGARRGARERRRERVAPEKSARFVGLPNLTEYLSLLR